MMAFFPLRPVAHDSSRLSDSRLAVCFKCCLAAYCEVVWPLPGHYSVLMATVSRFGMSMKNVDDDVQTQEQCRQLLST